MIKRPVLLKLQKRLLTSDLKFIGQDVEKTASIYQCVNSTFVVKRFNGFSECFKMRPFTSAIKAIQAAETYVRSPFIIKSLS